MMHGHINTALSLHKVINLTMTSQHDVLKSTYSCQNSGFQSDRYDKKPQYRRAISHNDYHTLQEIKIQEQKPTFPSPSISHILIPISPSTVPITHREIKSGRQRFRWNLIFNVLVWIICPLPLWLPFISYLQFKLFFVFFWFIISLLAA
jgi:hypothetical protein